MTDLEKRLVALVREVLRESDEWTMGTAWWETAVATVQEAES